MPLQKHTGPIGGTRIVVLGQDPTSGDYFPLPVDPLLGQVPTAGGSGGGATTIANGADVNSGATTDAAATAGSTGTISSKLRFVTSILNTISTAIATLLTEATFTGRVGEVQATPTANTLLARLKTIADNIVGTLIVGGGGINVAASVDVNESGTADVDAAVAAVAGLRLMGYSVRESAGTAAVAALRIMHGATAAGGTSVCRINLNADESERMWFGPDGIACPNGISIDRESGSTEVDLYHKTVA